MTNTILKTCAHCGVQFDDIYVSTDGYSYNLNKTYCTMSCASKSKTNKGCIMPDIGKDALKQEAITFMQEKNEYCTQDELCSGIKRSSKTLLKHGLKVSELNRELGYAKPKSSFQEKVGEILSSEFPNVEREKTFEGLVGTTGYPLRVDFYIPELNTVIEADGSQHKDPNHPWREFKNGTVAQYDDIKNKFFEDKGITLQRVPYKRNLKSKDVIKTLGI